MPKIVLMKKAEILAEYQLGKKNVITIGSAKGNDIILPDKNISEQHCSISRKNDGYEVKDNNTIAGTRVNDKPITVKDLQMGDMVNIGPYSLMLRKEYSKTAKGADGAFPETRPLYLIGIYGRFEGKKFDIKLGDTCLGRENVTPRGITNDIVLSGDMTVSKGHAKFTRNDDQCVIADTGSTGGIAVNGNKVGQLNEVPVRVDDEIAIGRTIFRIAQEGNENYSYPKRHNIFLLKIRRPLITAMTALIGVAAIIAIINGASGLSIISSKPSKTDIDINRFWSPEDNIVRTSAPPEYDITSSPAIGDLSNDGTNDIVYLNSSGQLCAWDGKKGGLLWKPVEIFNSGKMSPVLYDMNNDGVLDIVVLSDTSMLYIIDGQTGGTIRREMLGGTIAELTPAVADMNGDGMPDVAVVSEEGMIHFIYSPGFDQKMEKYSEYVEGPVYASPVIISTKKISPLIVICAYNSKIYILDGKTREKKTVDLVEKTGKAHLLSAPAGVGDLNGDDVPEIVVQSNVPQYISVVDITHFDVNWTYFVEPVPPSGIRHTSAPLIADINGDGVNDVIICSANGYIFGLKGKTGYPAGELMWKMEIPGGGRMITQPAMADLDKDGLLDLVFGTDSGNIFVAKNYPSRKEMQTMTSVKASNAAITSSVAIGDVNRDGLIEIIYSNVGDVVQVLNTNIRTFKSKVVWPMYLGSSYHAGSLAYKVNASPYYVLIISGLGAGLVLSGAAILVKRKRVSKRPKVVSL